MHFAFRDILRMLTFTSSDLLKRHSASHSDSRGVKKNCNATSSVARVAQACVSQLLQKNRLFPPYFLNTLRQEANSKTLMIRYLAPVRN